MYLKLMKEHILLHIYIMDYVTYFDNNYFLQLENGAKESAGGGVRGCRNSGCLQSVSLRRQV